MEPTAAVPRDRPDTGVAILMLGMHRSGTSAVTGLLGTLGAGMPRDAMPASGENSRGYFESIGVARAGERLLRAARSSWFDPRALDLSRLPAAALAAHRADLGDTIAAGFGGAPLIALKDPRQCRFVGLAEAALAERGYASRAVLVVRGADDVAASLRARDGMTPDHARLLWLRHMLDAERDSRGAMRAVIRFDALLDDWPPVVDRLLPLLGRRPGSLSQEVRDAVHRFLSPALRHHRDVRLPEEFAELAQLVRTAEAAFAALADEDGTPQRAALDRVAERLRERPWIEGDAIHDELRHRRSPAPAPAHEPVARDEPPPPPALEPLPDEDETVRAIRESGLFDRDYYLRTYPDVTATGLDPIVHYVTIGAPKGRNPSALFNTGFYARQMARRPGAAA